MNSRWSNKTPVPQVGIQILFVAEILYYVVHMYIKNDPQISIFVSKRLIFTDTYYNYLYPILKLANTETIFFFLYFIIFFSISFLVLLELCSFLVLLELCSFLVLLELCSFLVLLELCSFLVLLELCSFLVLLELCSFLVLLELCSFLVLLAMSIFSKSFLLLVRPVFPQSSILLKGPTTKKWCFFPDNNFFLF